MSKRVVVHLRPDVPVESDFLEAYEAMPRRAEWVRRTLLRGFVEERRRLGGDEDFYEGGALLGGALGAFGLTSEMKGDDRS